MRRPVLVAWLLIAFAGGPAPAFAECGAWNPVVTVDLAHPPRLSLSAYGSVTGIHFTITLTNPTAEYVRTKYGPGAWRLEVETESGEPVDLSSSPRLAGESHSRSWNLRLKAGATDTLRVAAFWLNFPRGGTYRIRTAFTFKDWTDTTYPPKCTAYSDWVTVELHPVTSGHGGPLWGPFYPRIRDTGLLVPDRATKAVWWVYREGPKGPMRRLVLGYTSEDPRKTDPRLKTPVSRFEELDARVDAAGIVHVVFPVAGDKTAYVRLGASGTVLERKELPGKKSLGGTSARIDVVDKPPR